MVWSGKHRPYDPNQPRVPRGVPEGGEWLPYPAGVLPKRWPVQYPVIPSENFEEIFGGIADLSARVTGGGLFATIGRMLFDEVKDIIRDALQESSRQRVREIAILTQPISPGATRSPVLTTLPPLPRNVRSLPPLARPRFKDPFRRIKRRGRQLF